MDLFFHPTHYYNWVQSLGQKHGKHDSANLSCIAMEPQGAIRSIGQVHAAENRLGG